MNTSIILPPRLYQNLAQKSRQLHRLPDDVVIELVEQYLRKPESRTTDEPDEIAATALPEGVQEEIDTLETFSQEILLEKAQLKANPDLEERFQELIFKRDSEGLTADEEQESWRIGAEFNRVMLVRTRAAELLYQRGYDIKTLYQDNPHQ